MVLCTAHCTVVIQFYSRCHLSQWHCKHLLTNFFLNSQIYSILSESASQAIKTLPFMYPRNKSEVKILMSQEKKRARSLVPGKMSAIKNIVVGYIVGQQKLGGYFFTMAQSGWLVYN